MSDNLEEAGEQEKDDLQKGDGRGSHVEAEIPTQNSQKVVQPLG